MRSFILGLGFLGLAACTAANSETGAASQTGASTDDSDTTVLLDCNVFEGGGGPDQEVKVEQTSHGLVLSELTEAGSWISRPLTQEEWKSADLKLTTDPLDGPEAIAHIYQVEPGVWFDEAKSDGFKAVGSSDCRNFDRR